MQGHVAGYFKQEVTNEENPCTQAVHCFAEVKVIEHLQFGKRDVHPIQVRDQIAKKQQG
ncbi:hypothetical protein D3C80_2153190 [compost metagenome]